MSDLDTTLARRGNATMSNVAADKLSNLSRSGDAITHAGPLATSSSGPAIGVIDAFADVFARMAVSVAPAESSQIRPVDSDGDRTSGDSEIEADADRDEPVDQAGDDREVALVTENGSEIAVTPTEIVAPTITVRKESESGPADDLPVLSSDSTDTRRTSETGNEDFSAPSEGPSDGSFDDFATVKRDHRSEGNETVADQAVDIDLGATPTTDTAIDAGTETGKTVAAANLAGAQNPSTTSQEENGKSTSRDRRKAKSDRRGGAEQHSGLAAADGPAARSSQANAILAAAESSQAAAQSPEAGGQNSPVNTTISTPPPADAAMRATAAFAPTTSQVGSSATASTGGISGVGAVRRGGESTFSSLNHASAPTNSNGLMLDSGATSRRGSAEATGGEAKGAEAKNGSTADLISRVKLVQRVSKAFQHLGPEGGIVRLRLAPAELGTVRVEMRIQQKKIEARVVADTQAAGSALREHLPDLRARLEAYGMQVERIEVETDLGADDSSGFAFSDNPQSSADRQPQRRSAADDRSSTTATLGRLESPPAVAPQASTGFASASGVDLRL